MLGFFPRLFPDETLYSVVSRYRAMVGGGNLRVLTNLFGEEARRFSIFFPSPVARLAASLPPRLGLDVEHIIDRHTMLPYFMRFVRQKAILDCRRGMAEGWRNRAAQMGLSGSWGDYAASAQCSPEPGPGSNKVPKPVPSAPL
jgi:TniQ